MDLPHAEQEVAVLILAHPMTKAPYQCCGAASAHSAAVVVHYVAFRLHNGAWMAYKTHRKTQKRTAEHCHEVIDVVAVYRADVVQAQLLKQG